MNDFDKMENRKAVGFVVWQGGPTMVMRNMPIAVDDDH